MRPPWSNESGSALCHIQTRLDVSFISRPAHPNEFGCGTRRNHFLLGGASARRIVIVVALGLIAHTPYAQESDYAENLAALHAYLGEHYAGFKLKGIDWDFVGESFQSRVVHVENDAQFGLLCMEMVAQLADAHCALLAGQARLPRPPIPNWGCGIACLPDVRGAPIIYFVEPDSFAAALGVKPGMEVKEMNGMPGRVALARMMADVGRFYGYSSPRALKRSAARRMIAVEEEGDTIDLVLAAPSGKEISITIVARTDGTYGPRRAVQIPGTNEYETVTSARLDGDIGYIYIRRIDEDLVPGLDTAVGGLGEIRGLVIDLRGNGGGGFHRDEAFVNFLSKEEAGNPDRPRFTGPIALLFDESSMSAAEGWGSWFVVTKRAKTFGRPSGGA